MFNYEMIGQTVTFDTYAPAIIGSRQVRVTILGVVDYTSVTTFQPAVRHTEVYSYLPSGSPKKYNEYSYIKVRDNNGNVQFFGVPWVNWDTLSIHEGKDMVVRLFDYPPSKVDYIRRLLLSHNITDFSIDDSN